MVTARGADKSTSRGIAESSSHGIEAAAAALAARKTAVFAGVTTEGWAAQSQGRLVVRPREFGSLNLSKQVGAKVPQGLSAKMQPLFPSHRGLS